MEDFRPTKYKLRCVAMTRVFEDDGLVLEDRQQYPFPYQNRI